MGSFILYGDTYQNTNAYYVTGFLAPDPVVYIRAPTASILLVPSMEKGRAQRESRISDIRGYDELGYREAVTQTKEPMAAMARILPPVLRDLGSTPFMVEAGFPVLLADLLRASGIQISPNHALLAAERRHKSDTEIEALARAQTRAEAAISQVTAILAESQPVDKSLVYRGVPLTCERLRAEVEVSLTQDNFFSEGLIIAPGPRSSDPHWEGSGPIPPNAPLILDFFPVDRTSRYHADVTRTLVKGTPHDEVARMHESVLKAQEVALAMIRPGANGREIHRAVVASFASDGYSPEHDGAQYIHGTGHGLGLEVHEAPSLGLAGTELQLRDVVSVEPGLYHPELGGIRIEDVVVVTENGYRNLNALPKDLVVA